MDILIGQGTGSTGGHSAPGGSAKGENMIMDGSQQTFMQDVIEASRKVPVLVDFWATWCGPCKQLTPLLEKVVLAAAGRIKLVKLDIDKNRPLVQQLSAMGLPLQSVPTVAAFWQGQIADIVQGAMRESDIKRFVESLLKVAGSSMPSADLLAEARAALEAQDTELALELFTQAIEQDPEKPEAWAGMVRALIALGRDQDAEAALAGLPAKIANHPEIDGARSALTLAAQGRAATAELATLEHRVAQNPLDHAARFDLATALNATDRRAEAAEALLTIMRQDRSWQDDGARKQLLNLFAAWGMEDPATINARRKLSSLLFV